MTSQMFLYENNAFGEDNIFLIVDFYLNTSSCIKINKYDGIYVLVDKDLVLFDNKNSTNYNMSAPPNMKIAILKYIVILN